MVDSATARLSRSKLRNTALYRFYLLPLSGLSMTLVGCVETDTPESKETDPTVDSGWYDTPTDDDADGYTVEGGDCDDSDVTINPGAPKSATVSHSVRR